MNHLTEKITLNPAKLSINYVEQSVNHVIILKSYIYSINAVYEALAGTESALFLKIREVKLLPSSFIDAECIRYVLQVSIVISKKP